MTLLRFALELIGGLIACAVIVIIGVSLITLVGVVYLFAHFEEDSPFTPREQERMAKMLSTRRCD